MAGPQNMYPGGGGGYPNPQQQGGMRQPFPGAGGNVGMMNPAQQGMMGQQGFGQMGPQMGNQMGNPMGGQMPGQMPNQMQQMQQQMVMQPQMQPQIQPQMQQGMQMQQQQAMQQQMQQMQMNQQGMGAVGGVMPPQQMAPQPPQQPMQPVQPPQQQQQGVTTPQQTPPQPPTPAQQSQPKDLNTAMLCRLGQETVHDIVSRTQELFSVLKSIQPPNGTPQGQSSSNDKKNKAQEQLKSLRILFKRLRVIYDKCNDNCQGMEYTHIESLIPLKDEWDMKSDEKKTSEVYKQSCEEQNEIVEQVMLKNKQLKEVIDNMRKIIWEINTMLAMRRS